MPTSVWVILGPEDVSPSTGVSSLVAQARRLATPAGTVTAVAAAPVGLADRLCSAGADRIFCLDGAGGGADPVAAAEAVILPLREARAEACLLSASPWGAEAAGRLAARLGAVLLPGCVTLGRDQAGRIEATRPVYGSRLAARVGATDGCLQVITLRPGGEVAGSGGGRRATLERLACVDPPGWVRRLGEERVPPEALDLVEAELVVAGGLGVGSRDGFALVEELARRLGGAVGATRMAVDAGWAPFSRQIGLTGRIISPRAYVACGISGSHHHMEGVREAQLIVAINTDPHAPIFTYADVGILGDVREVLPALIRAASRLPTGAGTAAELFGAAGGRAQPGEPPG